MLASQLPEALDLSSPEVWYQCMTKMQTHDTALELECIARTVHQLHVEGTHLLSEPHRVDLRFAESRTTTPE